MSGTKRHAEDVQHSSLFSDWATPVELFEPLNTYFGGFHVDVAASAENRKAGLYYGRDHHIAEFRDGLKRDWGADAMGSALARGEKEGTPRAFMNPPFARNRHIPIGPWIEKAAYEASRGLTVVGLIPASVQTKWWQRHVRLADEIWFITRRVSFVATPAMLAEINRRRLEQKKKTVTKAWTAGNNTAVVIWRPDPGFVRRVEPAVRYWSYKTHSARRAR